MQNYTGNSTKSGIYQIRNLVNNKVYIGSSFRFGNRKSQHFKSLKENKHDNPHLQSSWNKHGEKAFVFEILEECDRDKLIEREQFYLDTFQPFGNQGYNNLKIAKSSAGFKHSEETKKRLSEMQIGRKVSQKVKDLLYIYSKGRIVTKETRNKLSKSHKGKRLSEGTKQKLSKFNSIAVCQYTKEGNLIQCFDSIKEAIEKTKTACQTITDSINKKRKTQKFIWKRKVV